MAAPSPKPSASSTSTKPRPNPGRPGTSVGKPAPKSASKSAPRREIPVHSQEVEVRRLLGANILVLIILVLLITSTASLAWYAAAKKVNVIAISQSGEIRNPIPLNQAFVNAPRVISFASSALQAAFSHDFANYRSTVSRAKGFFTEEGSKSFQSAIDPLLEKIRQQRLVMSITFEPPVIMRGPYLYGGRVMWDVQSVITLFFQGTQSQYPVQKRLATMTVVRVPLDQTPRGVAIDSIQIAPYTPRN